VTCACGRPAVVTKTKHGSSAICPTCSAAFATAARAQAVKVAVEDANAARLQRARQAERGAFPVRPAVPARKART
jgi:hypothetical protein